MITDNEFTRIVYYIKKRYGIDLSQKKVLITGRMENYLIRNGYSSYHEYMERVESNPEGEEARNLINTLTTNHTYFMRESGHFEFLEKVVLPQLKKKVKDRDLRIWSAATATGEEPYTLAMILMDYFGIEKYMWDTKVLATDVSTKALEFAKKGRYLSDQIEPLPDKWKQRYFHQIGKEEFEVKDELRNEVIFRQFNLMNPFLFRKKFHVIFLRNVMIYFSEDTRYELLEKVYNSMEPGGYLFVGTTEPIDKTKTKFQYVASSIYRK